MTLPVSNEELLSQEQQCRAVSEGTHRSPQNSTFFVRIPLDGSNDHLSYSVPFDANHPPALMSVLEVYLPKYSEIHPSSTGELYGYIKLLDPTVNDYIDVDPVFYLHETVSPGYKIELWYKDKKTHPNAILLTERESIQEAVMEEPEREIIHVRIYINKDFFLQDDIPLMPGGPHMIDGLLLQLIQKHGVLKNFSCLGLTYAWIWKKIDETLLDTNCEGEVEEGATYEVHFVKYSDHITKETSTYVKINTNSMGKLQAENLNNEVSRPRPPATQKNHPNAILLTKSECIQEACVEEPEKEKEIHVRIYKDKAFLLEEDISMKRGGPQMIKDLLIHLVQKHEILSKHTCYDWKYAWIWKNTDETLLDTNCKGEVEEGATYEVHFVKCSFNITKYTSTYIKINTDIFGKPRAEHYTNEFFRPRPPATQKSDSMGAKDESSTIKGSCEGESTRLVHSSAQTHSDHEHRNDLHSLLNIEEKVTEDRKVNSPWHADYAGAVKSYLTSNQNDKKLPVLDCAPRPSRPASPRNCTNSCVYETSDPHKERLNDILSKLIREELKKEDPTPLPSILQNVSLPPKPATEDSRKAITLVLLGETGVGKSTLINGIVNYLSYSSLSDAELNRLKCLIPAKFAFDGKSIRVGEQSDNEHIQIDGESATQRPKVYEFTQDEQLYRIIDVPGIGDSRGVEQDRKNFDYILEEINRHEEINAFCILIPPNNSRITVAMRYCIYELLSNLHKDAAKNIVFCFTKARSTFYKGGDILPILRDYLDKLKSQQDVEIQLREDRNMFYFDNEPFKFLCLKANGIHLDHERKEYDKSFNVSMDSTQRLFSYVKSLPPHDTTAMKALTETRRLILNMVPISAATSKKIQMNKASLKAQIEKLHWSRAQSLSLEEHLYFDDYYIVSTPLDRPRTVCASRRCTDMIPVGTSGRFDTHYKQICHDNCLLTQIQPGTYPNEDIKSCMIFPKYGEKICNKCGCDWEFHLHINHLQKIQMRKALNKELQKTLRNKNGEHLTLADVIKSYEAQLEQLTQDEELIKKISARFSTFLRNNSMSIRNDVYADYLKHALKLAEQEVGVGGSYEKVAELRMSLRAYEEEVNFLQSGAGDSGPVTMADIHDLKKELCGLAERHGEIVDLLCIAEGETQKLERKKSRSKTPVIEKRLIKEEKEDTKGSGVKTYNRKALANMKS
ncbi:hypothetical protein QR680_004433 [Steinernema hermaphroditum]|uniref:DUF8206 domain-containing protein n=1 Tax=Steinernema hermaphroditum TaxID=289476 RepID=A0AA39HNQ3_9BILA|nr:hypothetical protein QR680_004433 [Steinernema hermaphroditum]